VPEPTPDELRARYSALAARLNEPDATNNLDALKLEIAVLFKAVDGQIAERVAVRDSVKELVEQWKVLKAGAGGTVVMRPSRGPSLAPAFNAERPSVQADHLGASTFIEKGWSKISLGDHAGAEEALQKALQLAPNDSQATSLLGWAQMLQDKFDDALMNFQKVLVREPQNSIARINVGYICLKKRIFGEAIEHLSRAIRLDNDRKATLYAHFYLGLVYLERDMFEDAQTFFQKTLALGPNLIEAYYELGRAFWFNGQRDEAIKTWTSGHEANKLTPWGKRCAEVLVTVRAGGEP
jgi:tetratricopeptide (TPR) repeat protein